MTNITLSCDQHELQQFYGWLERHGFNVDVSESTGSYVDGEHTSSRADASEFLNALWDEYCLSGIA